MRRAQVRARFVRQHLSSRPRTALDYVVASAESRWRRAGDSPRYEGSLREADAVAFLRDAQLVRPPGPALDEARQAVAAALAADPGSASAIVQYMSADVALAEFVYHLIRGVRPDHVIETGVAAGVTSAYALAALEDNGHGRLHSIDLPDLDLVEAGQVGRAVPPTLADRWRYHWGSSRRLLRPVLERTNGRRIFIHDSDHSYRNMRWELDVALEALTSGDWIVADDVDGNRAFEEVAAGCRGDAFVAPQAEKPATTGVLALR